MPTGGEDGLGGFCDDQQNLCLCVALWNGKDPILKERLFGLTNAEGNHGEDVKELYYYLDATPTYSYARMLYKYPQAAYPYAWLVAENGKRSRLQPEFEILDTGIFDEDRYFDVDIEYAKADVDDILLRITLTNRGRGGGANHRPAAGLVSQHVELVQGREEAVAEGAGRRRDQCRARNARQLHRAFDQPQDLLFCDNETNARKLFGAPDVHGYFKDAFHEYLVAGNTGAVNPASTGTKAAGVYAPTVPAGGSVVVRPAQRDHQPEALRRFR